MMSVRMSKGQSLRALVKERLAAAAEDIFVLFEKTMVEYEEELCRFKEEQQRKQQLYPTIELVEGNAQIPSWSPEAGLNQEVTETLRVKEEPEEQSHIKQEEEPLPVNVLESSVVCVQIEESTEETSAEAMPVEEMPVEAMPVEEMPVEAMPVEEMPTDEILADEISSETLFSETEVQLDSFDSDDDVDWEPPPGSQIPNRDRTVKVVPTKAKPAAESSSTETVSSSSLYCLEQDSVVSVDLTDIANSRDKADRAEHQCPCCQKIFANKRNLLRHISVHTGEKPHSCSICHRRFTQRSNLDSHVRAHTGEKSYSCPVCEKTFNRKHVLESHIKTHSEALFRCSICHKAFSQQSGLNGHMNIHRLPESEAKEMIANNPDYR